MMQAGVSASMIRESVLVFRLILDTVVEDDVLSGNPAVGVQLPPRPHHEIRPLTVEQVEALVEAIAHQV